MKPLLLVIGCVALGVSVFTDMVSAPSYFRLLVISITSGCVAMAVFLVRSRQTRGVVRVLFALGAAISILLVGDATKRFIAVLDHERVFIDETRGRSPGEPE